MALFENLTFHAIINQTVKPDFWVVVVDGELPSRFRLRLEELTTAHEWIVVHQWNPTCDWYRLGWVIDLFSIETPFVLTSLIDDDDALDLNYNERLRNRVDNHIRVGSRFGWFWFGSLCALEWDLDFSTSEFGFTKPFAGGTDYWQGVGTSVLVPLASDAPTAYSWSHSVMQDVFGPLWRWRSRNLQKVMRYRLGLVIRLLRSGRIHWLPSLIWSGWVHDIGTQQQGEFDKLISNSGTNLQEVRMTLGHDARDSQSVMEQLLRFGMSSASMMAIRAAFLDTESNREE